MQEEPKVTLGEWEGQELRLIREHYEHLAVECRRRSRLPGYAPATDETHERQRVRNVLTGIYLLLAYYNGGTKIPPLTAYQKCCVSDAVRCIKLTRGQVAGMSLVLLAKLTPRFGHNRHRQFNAVSWKNKRYMEIMQSARKKDR